MRCDVLVSAYPTTIYSLCTEKHVTRAGLLVLFAHAVEGVVNCQTECLRGESPKCRAPVLASTSN
jgi:hypothetical protein